MKKLLSFTIIFCCVLAMPVVASMKSNSANDNASQNNKSDLNRPVYATDIEMAKKKILSPEIIKEMKSGPKTLSGQDKKKKVPVEENAATGILGDALETGANKYAVIVGVCDYPGTANDLCWSDGDSLNMHQALLDSGYEEDNIYMFRDYNVPDDDNDPDGITTGPAVFKNIHNAVMNIEAVTNTNYNSSSSGIEDEIVFFFSGHGASGMAMDNDSERKDESIVVHDGTNAVFIWDGQLREWFEGFKTSRIIFIFDSCRAEGMNDVMKEGRIVVAGSEETKVGYVLSLGDEYKGEFGEGVFTHYFVNQGMLEGLADKYDNISGIKDVTIEEAFDYAKKNIPDYYRRQNPVINDDFTNDLLLGY